MTDSRLPADDFPEDDEQLLRRLLELDECGFDLAKDSEASKSRELLERIQRTQSLLRLVGRVGTASTSGSPIEQETETDEGYSPRETAPESPAQIGRFKIQGELGRGGCGIVFRAVDPKLNRTVALKVPRPGALLSEDMRQRFVREALAAAALDHPNITAVFEAGEDNFLCYIASALCAGPTMDHWLRNREQLPAFELAAEITRTLAHAVHHAHSRGVLHRDLKPGNVIMAESPEATSANGVVCDKQGDTVFIPRLTDFGLARLDECSGQSTATGIIVGTYNYMAPEQAEGRGDITTAVDIYGLGAILFELLTGRPRFQVSSHRALLDEMNKRPVASVRSLRTDVPVELETICLKCLNHDASHRYQSALEVADELQRFLNGEPIRARRASPMERFRSWCRRRPAIAALTATSLLLGLALVFGSIIVADMLLREKKATAEQLFKTQSANIQLREATRLAETRTVEALLAQAGRARISGRAGRRFEGIAAIIKAASIAAELDLGEATKLSLRNELLACASLPDLREDAHWNGYRKGSDQTGIAISPDAEAYAFFLPDGSLSIRRFNDNSEVCNISDIGYSGPHKLPQRYLLRFSPDGSMIASVGEHANINHADVPTRIWNIATGELLLSVSPEGYWSTDDVDFSADSSQAAVGFGDGTIRLYSLPAGEEVAVIEPTDDGRMATIVRFSPSREFLAVVRESRIEIWNTVTFQLLKTSNAEQGFLAVEWLPNGEEIACVIKRVKGLRILRASCDGADFKTILATIPLQHTAFHPNGRTVATVESRTTSLFDLESEQKLFDVDGLAIRFGRDGRYLAFGLIGSRVGRWEYSSAPECQMVVCSDAITDRPCLSFSRDNLLAVCCKQGIRLIDPDRALQVAMVPKTGALLGQFLQTCDELLTVTPSAAELRLVDWSPSRHVPAIGEPRMLVAADSSPLTHGLLGAAEKEALICRENGIAHIVALADPSIAQQLKLDTFWTLAVSPDRRWAVTTHWHTSAVLWNATIFKALRDLDCIRARAEFSRDGRWLAVGNSQDYHVYSVGDWSVACHVDRDLPGQGLGATAFTSDSQLLAMADSLNTVRVFNTSDWSEAVTLTLPISSPPYWLTFSPDRSRLAACTSEGIVCIWNLQMLGQHLARHNLSWSLGADRN